MNYEERIRNERPGMSKSFAKLADFLLDSYIEASFMTASELAHALNLDAATVVRFSQQLGYRGYPDLLREIRDKVRSDLLLRPIQAEEPGTLPSVVNTAMNALIQELEQTRVILDTNALNRLVEAIENAQRVILFAEAPAQPAVYNLAYFLEQGGFPVYVSRLGIADQARTVYNASPDDLLIAVDITGQLPYIAYALREARSRHISTAAIVSAASLRSARFADIVLAAQEHPSEAIGILAIDAICYVLVETLKWRYPERYDGAGEEIAEITDRIQQGIDE